MSLFLAEFGSVGGASRARSLLQEVERAAAAAGGELIEAQVGEDSDRLYVVVEHADRDALGAALADGALPRPPDDLAEVRLVGSTLDAVKAARGDARYLVEWDLPETLTMERYLERKRQNSVHYAKVPEVRFLRTYVREDLDKCLCLYDAPDADCVKRAREAVSAPIDRLTRVEGAR